MENTAAVTAEQAADYAEYVSPLVAQLLPPFLKLAAVQPGERVLDLGCGPGDAAIEVALRSGDMGEVLGIDSSPEFVALAHRRALDAGVRNVRFEVGDACALSLNDSYWDVVTCHLGVTEFADPRAMLAEVQRVLRPVGRLAISTWGEWQRSPWLAGPFEGVHVAVPSRSAAARAQPFRYGEPGVLSGLLADNDYADVTPDRATASLEYEDAQSYWYAFERGLAYGLSPLLGLTEEQSIASRDAAEFVLRKWRYPRQERLRLPVQAFLAVAVK